MNRKILLCTAVAALAANVALAQPPGGAKVSPQARAAHEAAIVLDTHFDTPSLFSRPGWSITERHDVDEDGSQVDLPRMIDGGADGGFFTIFTSQGPRTKAGNDAALAFGVNRGLEIREMIARNPTTFELALTADDAVRIAAAKKRIVFMSMENAYPLGDDPGKLQTFYGMGVRMVGFAHFANNDFADSATGTPEVNGLSEKGKALLAEMNRLGVIPDPSHSSDAVLEQVIALSKTPVVLSHSGAAAIYKHPRNVPDDLIKKLAAKGGVIQINAYNAYMIDVPANADRDKALAAIQAKYRGRRLTEAEVVAQTAERRAVLAQYPVPRANFDDLMKHMMHVIKLVGVDHVGFSGDFDGGGGIDGFNSVADYPKVTEYLLKNGYTKDDVAKIWGGNVLRVLRETEAYAKSQKAGG